MSNLTDPGESGYDRDALSNDEEDLLQSSLNRAFEDTRSEGVPTLQDKIEEYWDEIKFTAEVARSQFGQRFDGQNPRNGYFGIDAIHPGFFGYDYWGNTPDPGASTAGTALYWIDGDAPDEFSSGTGGRDDPLQVGDSVVHLVLGVTSYADSPVATRHQFFKNDNPRSAFSSVEAFQNTDLKTQWLDAPMVLAEDDNIAARFLSSQSDSTESLALRGVTFIKEKASRKITTASMAGDEAIVTLGN